MINAHQIQINVSGDQGDQEMEYAFEDGEIAGEMNEKLEGAVRTD